MGLAATLSAFDAPIVATLGELDAGMGAGSHLAEQGSDFGKTTAAEFTERELSHILRRIQRICSRISSILTATPAETTGLSAVIHGIGWAMSR